MYTIPILPVTRGKKKQKTMRLPPSLNKIMHWSEKRAWNKEFALQVHWSLKALHVPHSSRIRATLINRTCYPMDRDNLYSSAKPLMDAVVRAGIIPDDKEQFLDLLCKNEKANGLKDQSVRIEIEILD